VIDNQFYQNSYCIDEDDEQMTNFILVIHLWFNIQNLVNQY